jgi:hypothetical protein
MAAVIEVEASWRTASASTSLMARPWWWKHATAVVVVADLVDSPHRAIGIEAAVVVDTTGVEAGGDRKRHDLQVPWSEEVGDRGRRY